MTIPVAQAFLAAKGDEGRQSANRLHPPDFRCRSSVYAQPLPYATLDRVQGAAVFGQHRALNTIVTSEIFPLHATLVLKPAPLRRTAKAAQQDGAASN